MGGKFHNSVGDKHSGSFSSVSLPGVYVTMACDLPRPHRAAASSADLALPMSARHQDHLAFTSPHLGPEPTVTHDLL